jgi:hypothetical protein
MKNTGASSLTALSGGCTGTFFPWSDSSRNARNFDHGIRIKTHKKGELPSSRINRV